MIESVVGVTTHLRHRYYKFTPQVLQKVQENKILTLLNPFSNN